VRRGNALAARAHSSAQASAQRDVRATALREHSAGAARNN
jgi:hypothetical protein